MSLGIGREVIVSDIKSELYRQKKQQRNSLVIV